MRLVSKEGPGKNDVPQDKQGKRNKQQRPDKPQVVLVLQGGGALGAYQAGVCEALQKYGFAPDWVVGTSIGAINAALIAGNPRSSCVSRLKTFWDGMAQNDLFDMRAVPDPVRQYNSGVSAFNSTLNGVRGFFSPRRFSPFPLGLPVPPENASFYDTAPLAETLTKLIDLDYLNSPDATRLTVNAVRVRCGQLHTFDSHKQRLGIEHVMASGALPPAFPPVRIDGDLYWDGGLYSNTPLETVLADVPAPETLCFMVDLWSAEGPEPVTLDAVQTREKDVMYASRSQRHIDAYLREHKLRRMLRTVHAKLPPGVMTAEEKRELAALGEETTVHIVRLAYAGRDWQMAAKDVNFSKGSIEWRWQMGYEDAQRAIKAQAWREDTPEGAGVVVHQVGIKPETMCD